MKQPIKTKKGKVISPNVAKVLAPPILIAGIFLAFGKSSNAAEEVASGWEILNNISEENIEEVPENEKMVSDMLENNYVLETNEIEIEENQVPDIMITQTTCVEVKQKENMKKREETDILFGAIIDKYTNCYGIPNCIGKAIITQERPNDSLENLGQLTRNICGEKIVIPLLGSDEGNLEKIYIVRDEPKRSNYDSESSYREQLNKYKNQLKESKELSLEGYQIYSFQEIMNHSELNIHISMAYLAHCIYKCDINISQGIRAYNGGYTKAKKASDKDIADGKIDVGDPYYNEHVYAYLYEDELNSIVWNLKNVSLLTENEKKEMTQEQMLEKEKEITKNTPVIVIDMNFSCVKELNYEENGHHL